MWSFHQKGMPVIGYDIDPFKIDCLKNGKSYIKHLGDEMMQVLSKSSHCESNDSYSKSVSVKTKRGFVVVNFDCKQKQTNRQNLYEYVNSTFKRHDFQSHCNES